MLAPTLFGSLPPQLRNDLLVEAPARRFSDRQIIQQRSDRPGGFWLIESGKVLVGRFLPEGEFRAVAQLVPGDSFGELAVFARNRLAVDSLAQGATLLRWIDAQRFEEALLAEPAGMRALVGVLALQLQELIGTLAGLRNSGSQARIAGLLVNMIGKDRTSGTVTVSQHQLGELLGLTRATINKHLGELELQGVVRRHYGRITVLDTTALARAALV